MADTAPTHTPVAAAALAADSDEEVEVELTASEFARTIFTDVEEMIAHLKSLGDKVFPSKVGADYRDDVITLISEVLVATYDAWNEKLKIAEGVDTRVGNSFRRTVKNIIDCELSSEYVPKKAFAKKSYEYICLRADDDDVLPESTFMGYFGATGAKTMLLFVPKEDKKHTAVMRGIKKVQRSGGEVMRRLESLEGKVEDNGKALVAVAGEVGRQGRALGGVYELMGITGVHGPGGAFRIEGADGGPAPALTHKKKSKAKPITHAAAGGKAKAKHGQCAVCKKLNTDPLPAAWNKPGRFFDFCMSCRGGVPKCACGRKCRLKTRGDSEGGFYPTCGGDVCPKAPAAEEEEYIESPGDEEPEE